MSSAWMDGSSEKAVTRSRMFSSWRMFPGQSKSRKVEAAVWVSVHVLTARFLAILDKMWLVRAGMSSRRSRNGGRASSMVFRR